MYTFKIRRDTAARWQRINPVLADGEPGFERDTGQLKIGNGSLGWNSLPYVSSSSSDGMSLLQHINSPEPHPVYDDGPSFVLLYENAKV